MTTHQQTGCSCPPMRELIASAFADNDAPPCAVHRPEPQPTEAIALNDDTTLAAKLGLPLTKGL